MGCRQMGNIYREIFDHINKGIAVFNVINKGEAFEFVEYNHEAELLDGKKRAAVVGKRLTEVFPFVREFGFLELLKKVYQTGQKEYRPLTFYTHEGHSFWREIELSLLSEDHILYVFSDLQNPSGREVKREELFFVSQEIIEKSFFPKQIINTNGSIEYVNHAFEKITGYSKEE